MPLAASADSLSRFISDTFPNLEELRGEVARVFESDPHLVDRLDATLEAAGVPEFPPRSVPTELCDGATPSLLQAAAKSVVDLMESITSELPRTSADFISAGADAATTGEDATPGTAA